MKSENRIKEELNNPLADEYSYSYTVGYKETLQWVLKEQANEVRVREALNGIYIEDEYEKNYNWPFIEQAKGMRDALKWILGD